MAFTRFLYSVYADRKEYVKFFTGIQQLAISNPKEAMAQLATVGVELALTGRLVKDATQLAARAKEFTRLFVQESQIAAAAATAGMDASTLNPLAKAIGGAAEKVKVVGARETAFANLCEEAYATCKELPPAGKSFWEHIFKWEEAKKTLEPKGFHSENIHQGKLIERLSLPADEFGVYAGFYEHLNWEKFSTFFPKNLNQAQIQEKIQQAFRNPIEKGKFIVIGQAADGMNIKIVFKYGQSNNIEIKSAFPLYRGEKDSKILLAQLGRKKELYHKSEVAAFFE